MDVFIQDWQPTASMVLSFLPEIILALTAMLMLALDVCFTKDRLKLGRRVPSVALAGVFVLCLAPMFLGDGFLAHSSPAGTIFGFADVMPIAFLTAFFPACAFLAIHLTTVVREGTKFEQPITNHLVLIATAAAMALMKSTNFVAFFVLLETVTVSLYALVGSYRKSAYSLEAGVKYLIAGGVSGGLMLFGIVLLYGAVSLAGGEPSDMLSYSAVRDFLAVNLDSPLGLAGAGMVIAGIMFKLGIFPMQFWIPDVYQGAPTHITFFLATFSKATGFFLMAIMLGFTFGPVFPSLFPVLLVLTLISIVYANVTALGQQNVKRLLGLSGISHAGYLMLGLLSLFYMLHKNEIGGFVLIVLMSIILFLYIAFYVTSLYPIFSVMARMPSQDDALQNFSDYRGLAKRSPIMGVALASGLGSLAGIPPTVGFITKLGILWIVFSAELYVPAAIMLACVVASVYYYFGWIRAAFSTDDGDVITGRESGEIRLPSIFARTTITFFTALTVVGTVIYLLILGHVS